MVQFGETEAGANGKRSGPLKTLIPLKTPPLGCPPGFQGLVATRSVASLLGGWATLCKSVRNSEMARSVCKGVKPAEDLGQPGACGLTMVPTFSSGNPSQGSKVPPQRPPEQKPGGLGPPLPCPASGGQPPVLCPLDFRSPSQCASPPNVLQRKELGVEAADLN